MAVGCSITRIKLIIGIEQIYAASITLDWLNATILKPILKRVLGTLFKIGNSHYETDFGVSSTFGAGNTKICFWKAHIRSAFQKQVFIMRIAALN
ncbi:hypothetical protein [Pseudanabaena sp. BC1403]|uniref:hypothetical protein n=1 Tax=Pseudanabaena sp. BC1403 TaxID=2043171 RepID=UPI000CD8C4F1|nr:hypothetical protein [Pseudanabaena sp. BC1403]